MFAPTKSVRSARLLAISFAALLCSHDSFGGGMTADGTATPDSKDSKAAPVEKTEEAPELKNWITLGVGGTIVNGDEAQFRQEHGMPGDVYGGIEDMHFEKSLGNDVELKLDGHAIFDWSDYDVSLEISKAKLGYIRAGYQEFSRWYDGSGGFFRHNTVWFDPAFDAMHIDRGEAFVEVGLRIPDWPEITVRYEHLFRNGMKDSTIWGDTTLTGLAINPARKVAPAFRDIDETRDIIAVEIFKNFGKTDVTIGMRYERSDNDNVLQLERGAGQLPPHVAPPGAQRFITQKDDITADIYQGHAITETRFSDSLWFTSAYSYTTLGSDISGSRILGEHYNSMFGDFPTLQGNDHAILNLAGTSEEDEHVFNSNIFWVPLTDLNVIAGFRYTHQETDTQSSFLDANTATSPAPTHYTPAIPKSGDSFVRLNNFAERLELRYTHITNWLFYLEGEWEEEFGDVHEHQVSGALVNNVPTTSDNGSMNKDNYLLGQKYAAGLTWYPMTRLNLAAQYYYKIADYDNDYRSELATPTDVPAPLGAERNQRLLGQEWHTQDVNVRITARPKIPESLGTLSLVSRYDFMQSAVSGKWGVSPAGPPPAVPPAPPSIPTGTTLDEERSGIITSHIFSETLNWNPLPRFYFESSFSYVLNETDTRLNDRRLIATGTTLYNSPTIVNFRNDYWTVTAGGGYVIDDKTDLRADYSFYRAPDFRNNARVAMPYGMGATEHTVCVTANRQITKNMTLLLRYCYFTFEDETSGSFNNYEAHSIFSGLQIRF